jgi:phosphatidylserine/phosphatidylglycerophosphate/cardiolipin synthase-like enzyme
VLIAENNADDSIRNIEHTVLSLIESATDSIDMYQFLAYSPEVGKALAAAVKRGVNVRILMDSVGQKVPMNATLGYFMDDAGLSPEQVESMIRWRAQLPGGTQIDGDTENPIEPQQQHVKTIVVDEKIVFGGSTNFDIASLAGAFREFSIAVKDNDAATKSHQNFNEIFASETNSVPYETLIPQNPSWMERLRNRIIKDILLTESWRIGALSIMNKLTRL